MNGDLFDVVKNSVADPAQAPAMHELLHQRVSELLATINGDERFANAVDYSDEELARRTDALAAAAAPVVQAAAWGGCYGAPNTRMLWPGLVGRLANDIDRTKENPKHDAWPALHVLPAVLFLYGAGVGAMAGDRPDLLAPLLARRTVLERNELRPVALSLYATTPFINEIANRLPPGRARTPASNRVFQAMIPAFEGLIPGEAELAHQFDRFEYLLSLVTFDMNRGDRDGDRGWAPVGRFAWRTEDGVRVVDEMNAEVKEMGSRWPLLRDGLFRGSPERLATAVDGIAKMIGQRW
jgi:hypothetical protein